jgi:hypothetical protein
MSVCVSIHPSTKRRSFAWPSPATLPPEPPATAPQVFIRYAKLLRYPVEIAEGALPLGQSIARPDYLDDPDCSCEERFKALNATRGGQAAAAGRRSLAGRQH